MRALRLTTSVLALLTVARAGYYCDDFEASGDFGSFWKQTSQDSAGQWKPTSYQEILTNVTDFPPPAKGDTILYLTTPSEGTTASARMETVNAYRFPAGSSISFRYWLRSTYQGCATFYATLAENFQEKVKIIDLSSSSSKDNNDWQEANAQIVADESKEYQIMIFATHTISGRLDNIAVDDITISGPDNLPDKDCVPITTTTETTTTTIEPTTTTTEPTTTEPTTTTTKPTTTEPTTTTTEPTTTEPTTTTTEPTTNEPTTTEPTTTVPTTTNPTTTEASTAESTTTTSTVPPTTTAGPTPTKSPTSGPSTSASPPVPTTPDSPPSDGRRYGPSGLLWVVFVVLGSSLVLALVLALAQRQRRREDQLELMRHRDSASGTSGDGGGWYQYVTNDPWARLHGRLKRIWT